MNKTYPIIKVGDYLYAVDKEVKKGDKVYATGDMEAVTYDKDKGWWVIPVEPIAHSGHWAGDDVYKTVATNNPSLKGVLQLPPEEEVWNEDMQVTYSRLMTKLGMFNDGWKPNTGHFIQIFQAGYKLGQSKGQYSEEDMRKAFQARVEWGSDQAPSNVPNEDEFLKSLSKVPKAIECIMETDGLDPHDNQIPKIDYQYKPKNNNGVVVGRYIYE